MITQVFNLALWLAGIGHFILPVAGWQIPFRLEWKKDLAQLKPFNRKLMWVYLCFITFVILSFGALTLIFHNNFIKGDPLALGLAFFIGTFWLIRVLVDFFYFKHSDWPKGKRFIVGHILFPTRQVPGTLITNPFDCRTSAGDFCFQSH